MTALSEPPSGNALIVRSTATITDNRTGQTRELPIADGAIAAADLRAFKTDDADRGLLTYDPGFANTASCRSGVTNVRADLGILEYRGYPADQLVEDSTYLDVAYLLRSGQLPSATQLADFTRSVVSSAEVPREVLDAIRLVPVGLHPLNILIGAFGFLGGFYPDSVAVRDPRRADSFATQILGQTPILAAAACRRFRGQEFETDSLERGVAASLLTMLTGNPPDVVAVRAVEALLVASADHEQDCSATAVRGVGSSGADPYAAIAAGYAALSGPLHGRLSEGPSHLWRSIGSRAAVKSFIAEVKAHDLKPHGFGHYMYRTHVDPRAKALRPFALEVATTRDVPGAVEIALELESIAHSDEYFVENWLYPTKEFYAALIYESLLIAPEMLCPLFAVGRTSGWTAQWLDSLRDPDRRTMRPQQIYVGPPRRDYASAN